VSGGEKPGILVREARESDAESIEYFRCSSGPWYEEEAENYIRTRMLRASLEEKSQLKILLAIEDKRLVGCGAYRPEGLILDDGSLLLAMRLQVMALSLADQGRRLQDRARLSDFFIQTVISDTLEHRLSTGAVTAIAAKDNPRSITVCERNGLQSQVQYDRRHVRLTGLFSKENS